MVRRIVVFWLPVVAWAAVILTASGPALGSTHTGSWLTRFLSSILGHPIAEQQVHWLHLTVRRCGHLFEYGILSALAFRAFRHDRTGFRREWAVAAVVLCVVLASADEWRQTFAPGRTGTPRDVALDTVGAAIAQAAIAWKLSRDSFQRP